MAKQCATTAPQILAGSVTLSVFFPLGPFVFVLALFFFASYSIRKWSAAGINFTWTLFAVTSSRMVNAGHLSRLQCMVMISLPSVVVGLLTHLLAESCCCLSCWALENGFSHVVKTHCVQFMWLQGLHPPPPYCFLITVCSPFTSSVLFLGLLLKCKLWWEPVTWDGVSLNMNICKMFFSILSGRSWTEIRW